MATSAAYEQASAALSGEANKLGYLLRNKVWRFKTWLLLKSKPWVRAKWQWIFENDPCLLNARTNLCFDAMAGYYNDSVPQGFMTADEAKRVFYGW